MGLSLSASQSPFSSGEVFHLVSEPQMNPGSYQGLNPLLVAGKYSTSGNPPAAAHRALISCLNPLLVAGKYSTHWLGVRVYVNVRARLKSQSPFSSGEVFHDGAYMRIKVDNIRIGLDVSIPF